MLFPEGRTIAENALYEMGSFNLEITSPHSTHATHETYEIAGSPTATEARERFSPDGRLLAYNSDESVRREVYVRPVGPSGGPRRTTAPGFSGSSRSDPGWSSS